MGPDAPGWGCPCSLPPPHRIVADSERICAEFMERGQVIDETKQLLIMFGIFQHFLSSVENGAAAKLLCEFLSLLLSDV